MKKDNKPWKHVGGGVALIPRDKYPADDTYERENPDRTLTVTCTKEAHFLMPKAVKRPSDLLYRKGVRSVEIHNYD